MKISDQKQYKKTILVYFILDIVLACSSCSLEQFLALTSFGVIAGDEAEAYIPWVFIIQLVLRGGQNQQII